jgi:hypothetical protein
MLDRLARSSASTPRTLLLSAFPIAVRATAPNARAISDLSSTRALPASAQVETDSYRVEMSTSGSYKAGATGSVTVTLTAKGVFHINEQYPYRFKTTSPSEGVTYPKPVLERADGQFQERTAVFQVPFVATRAGNVEVGGIFNLSVCSPNACVVKKTPLEISITVGNP